MSAVTSTEIAIVPEAVEAVAGRSVRGVVRLEPRWRQPGVVVTVVLAWFTEGKGDRDEGAFERVIADGRSQVGDGIAFEVAVPAKPWSYDGKIVKIRWTLRAVAAAGGMRIQAELPFIVRSPFGAVPAEPYRGAPLMSHT